MKSEVAKIVRMISVPPIMITVLITILFVFRPDYFHSKADIRDLIILLGIIPILAYPLQKYLPKYKDTGRRGQRKLAFITNLIGYTSAFLWSIMNDAGSEVRILCSMYFFSVLILTICNKLHLRASGHASSFTGPLLLLTYTFGWKMIFPCILVAGIIMWSSLYLKRHSLRELIAGIGVCTVSFLISYICWR